MQEDKWTLGLESTAHTLSFGLVDPNGIPYPSKSASVRPDEGGIHPRKAAEHHSEHVGRVLQEILESQNLQINDIGLMSFSQGPGLAPCLRAGAAAARSVASMRNIPLIGVNHCVAHIEIGRQQCGCRDPVLLYASGGNTQIIARLEGRYRVLGETLDIGIGNMLDKFARVHGIPFPGGPVIERLANKWVEMHPDCSLGDYSLPYVVQGMDLAFSGILTAAVNMVARGAPLEAVCWSLQEHAFAACVEVAERALAHTGKDELLLGGGVACNERLRNMSDIMCQERGGESFVPAKMYCIDNGTMIARLGWLEWNSGRETIIIESGINKNLRTDDTPIVWA